MEYVTVLWITVLGTQVDGSTSGLLYPSIAECEAATTIISATLPYDHTMECEETVTLSASIRPMPRPEGLGQ